MCCKWCCTGQKRCCKTAQFATTTHSQQVLCLLYRLTFHKYFRGVCKFICGYFFNGYICRMKLVAEKQIWRTVGDHIRDMGIKKSRLAFEINVSNTTIGLYLQGERRLSEDKELKLLTFLNLNAK